MTIDEYRKICRIENIFVTAHARLRLIERGISILDIETAINNGCIIEEYPEDTPFPSCLILGWLEKTKAIHVVVSINDGVINLITAYLPSLDRWGEDFRTRKGMIK